MPGMDWEQAIENWRNLSAEEIDTTCALVVRQRGAEPACQRRQR